MVVLCALGHICIFCSLLMGPQACAIPQPSAATPCTNGGASSRTASSLSATSLPDAAPGHPWEPPTPTSSSLTPRHAFSPGGECARPRSPPCCPPTPSLAGFPPSSSPGATPPSTAQEAGRVSSVLCGRSSRIPTQQVRLWGGSHQPGQQDSLRPGRPAHVCIVNISTEN